MCLHVPCYGGGGEVISVTQTACCNVLGCGGVCFRDIILQGHEEIECCTGWHLSLQVP